MRPALLALCALLAWPTLASAQAGRYRIEGEGPEGRCLGAAFVDADPLTGGLRVVLKTTARDGAERRARAAVEVEGGALAFAARATTGWRQEPALSGDARRAGPGALRVTWRDIAGRVVRRETWTRDDEVVIPIAVVALRGGGALPDVSAEAAGRAQVTVLAALDEVYAPLGIRFRPATPAPTLVEAADVDGDGRLARAELERVRDDLEVRGVKRPGRIVLVITAAAIVGEGCRGWTLGHAPATPGSLGDVNDNISVVGLAYLDPARFHTVAHEVGHQLGLDDVSAENRLRLARPDRADQLMESGGSGRFLDPAMARLVREAALLPDHGLDGRRRVPAALPGDVAAGSTTTCADEGLPLE